MTSTLLKYNVRLIVLCIGITLIHNSSGAKDKKDINLYYDPISPPCRSVLLTLEALNLEFNLIYINLMEQKQLAEDFRKINSLHTVPVIVEGDFVLWESHAIITYLVEKYGREEDKHLYPNSPKLQAKVDQLLYFDNSYFYPAFKNQYNSWIFYRVPKTQAREDNIHKLLQYLEDILKESLWVAGQTMTVADFALVATMTTFEVAGVDLSRYGKINEWLTKCSNKMIGIEEVNDKGINVVRDIIKAQDKKFADTPQIQSL